jgi:hypothetical protein
VLLQVKQRDSEIAIMIGMVKGKSSSIAQVTPATAATGDGAAAGAAGGTSADTPASGSSSSSSSSGQVLSTLLDARLLADRHAAFEVFRKSYRQGEVRRQASLAHQVDSGASFTCHFCMGSLTSAYTCDMLARKIQRWFCLLLLLPGD